MEICAYNFKPYKAKMGCKSKVMIVRMSQTEAKQTIHSLISQLISGNPNGERYECFDINGVDFSIAVVPDAQNQGERK